MWKYETSNKIKKDEKHKLDSTKRWHTPRFSMEVCLRFYEINTNKYTIYSIHL
jgi:hypothetical protein